MVILKFKSSVTIFYFNPPPSIKKMTELHYFFKTKKFRNGQPPAPPVQFFFVKKNFVEKMFLSKKFGVKKIWPKKYFGQKNF